MRGGWGRQDYGQRGHTTIHSVALRSPFPGLGRLAVTAASQMCLAPLLAAPTISNVSGTAAGSTSMHRCWQHHCWHHCWLLSNVSGTAAGCWHRCWLLFRSAVQL